MKNKNQSISTRLTVVELSKMAIVTALYVAVTLIFSYMSFGVVQIRLSEMFNFLPLFNRRYTLAVTLGVALSNMASPLGMIDVIVGSLSTWLVLLVVLKVTQKINGLRMKMVVTTILFSFSMLTIAAQLTILSGVPFLASWLMIAIGELLSMSIGGIIIYLISRRVDLS